MDIKACIFDLDGVVVDTAHFHFQAWRRLARTLGTDLSEAQNELLKGVSRRGSLLKILEWGQINLTEAEIRKWMDVKNNWYRELVAGMTPADLLPGVEQFILHLRERGIATAIGSSSRNTPTILERVAFTHAFDAIVHGGMVERGKPDPAIFLKGAEMLGVDPAETIVFEDAPRGVEAALAGGFIAVGIGNPDVLADANLVLPDLLDETIDSIVKALPQTEPG